jgi:glycerophosphoryl diester phosphodiesterase
VTDPIPSPSTASAPAGWPGVAARREGRTLRFGHMGAHAIVPGNTLASIEHAAQLGVDVVEFDAFPDGYGGVRVAHDPLDLAGRPDAPTLAVVLDRLCQADLAHLAINLDLKVVGDERQVVDELRDRGMVDRVLISSMEQGSLRALRRIDPGVRIGRSVPHVTKDYYSNLLTRPAVIAMVLAARRYLPPIVVADLREGRIDAVMAHWSLVTPAFARRVLAHGELYVWTVNDARRIAAMRALGVTGVTSDDPRLLAW